MSLFWKVSLGDTEADFIANGENGTEYYQVALTVRDASTLKRELSPLDSINDHNPKYLLTLDDDPPDDHNGIKQINALDWLLREAKLKGIRTLDPYPPFL